AANIPERPVGGGAGRFVVMRARAVAVIQRQRAPQRAVRARALLGDAERQQRAFADVGFDDAVIDGAVLAVVVEVGVLALLGYHQAPAQVAGNGAADIGVDAVQIPRTGAGLEARLRLRGRPLAHEVHGRGRVAVAGGKTGGAAHDFDAVIGGGVDIAVDEAVFERDADAVDLEVGDVETACGVVGAVGLGLIDADAGG